MRTILLLNGPNLNMLGKREPAIYGADTLQELEEMVCQYAAERGVAVSSYQSNSEAELIDKIHGADGRFDGVVYNPGAHTHYSYALRDAIAAVSVPVVEVHISDIANREPFRSVSVIAPACVAQVKGLGIESYCRALDILCDHEGLPRLGEGYENRFPLEASIIMAGGECGLGEIEFDAGDELYEIAYPFEEVSDITIANPRFQEAEAEKPDMASFANDVTSEDLGLASRERQNRVRAMCEQVGLDALLVRDTSNIRWITALDGVFDAERAHALLVGRERVSLHTDSRYSNAISTAARHVGNDIAISDERISHAKFAKAQLVECGQPNDGLTIKAQTNDDSPRGNVQFTGRLGIEDTVTYAEFVKLAEEFGTVHLSATTDFVLGLRAVKSAAEFTRLRAAQAVTDAAFMHILHFMRVGMTEREVQLELEDYMLRHGGEALAFSSIVATGANGADPHAIPGDTVLEAGQCVVMDFGAKAYGYCSDMTRTVFLGRPDAMLEAAWDVLRCANETVEAMLRPGVTGKEAHETAERVLAEGGFEGRMGHGLGHGVGIDVHELPVLSPRNESPLVAGNVVTVEPGIYLPGEFGMRLEDCGVITVEGYEAFSAVSHEMIIV